MARPIIFVAADCEHCRELLALVDASGRREDYDVVDVRRLARVPQVLRVIPALAVEGRLVTDEALFAVFEPPSSANQEGVFGDTFRALDAEDVSPDVDTGHGMLQSQYGFRIHCEGGFAEAKEPKCAATPAPTYDARVPE